jgi:tripartite-type tricarboxylate transporter receptor subunit TctC
MKPIVLFFAALLLAGSALAQTYPNRSLRMVIPWPPGQATDLVGRVMAEKLSQLLGQPVVPDNRPGAGGMIGPTPRRNPRRTATRCSQARAGR